MFDFGHNVCSHLSIAEKREWLVTNGIGGFASGTIAGMLTRRYHGLLVAALNPPLGRALLLAKLDETASYNGHSYPLFTNRWSSGATSPYNLHYLKRFHLEGTTPVWTFSRADFLLEKRIWMQPDANTTYIRYNFVRGKESLALTARALVNYRDYHGATRADNRQMDIAPLPNGLRVTAFDGATPFYILSDQAQATPQHEWYQDFYLSQEAYRGFDGVEDHLYAGDFRAVLQEGQSLTLVASTKADPNLDGTSAYAKRQAYEKELATQAAGVTGADAPAWQQHLVLAADQFIVRRPLPNDPAGRSVIAGYPWFGDWGRDTMIALPGLTLSTGRPNIARRILQTFARFVDRGMLPNRFPDAGEEPEYNTVDATLWYFHAIHQYTLHTGDKNLAEALYPTLVDIIEQHRQGTRYNIHIDAADGLLYAGEAGVQLTWMDAKVGDWVVTPRIGKPVEVNALWHNALRVMAFLSQQLGKSKAAQQYARQADFVAGNFRRRFWFEAGGYLYDVIDAPPDASADPSLRPNQIFAVSLPFQLLGGEQAKAVVDTCARHLFIPCGLRSLSPDDPAYIGRYGGNQRQRDGAYHQGTVWAWLLGPFVRAHLRVYQDPTLARSYLQLLIHHLAGAGVGSLSEIFDGDPPFTARGCPAQAWSVAELLRAWQEINPLKKPGFLTPS